MSVSHRLSLQGLRGCGCERGEPAETRRETETQTATGRDLSVRDSKLDRETGSNGAAQGSETGGVASGLHVCGSQASARGMSRVDLSALQTGAP